MKDNYCVIMGGGIGSRFWPFSRESYPKQFLDFFGAGRSLLQLTFDRFAKIIPKENIYVVTNESYASLMKEQLPDLKDNQILLEPSRRNTAPCIAYAAYHIRACNPNANIVVAPSDHLILKEDVFLQNVQRGLEFVKENRALVTLGIKPSRPETGYGYIQSDETAIGEFSKVKTFTEKPNPELAQVFYESGEFFWNSGLFLWNVDTIIEAFSKYLPDINNRFDLGKDLFNTPEESAFIQQQFPYCPNISIDYGIMEKADNVYMMCVDFGWADLGTWGSLYDMAPKDEQQNAALKAKNVLLYESSGNLIAMDNPERLVVIEGLDGYIVAESGNALLICRKDDEQRIKQFVADIQLKYGKEFN
ncbi:mannose-1-phosphate guanylyltransferase [Parabacteroides sp. PF5-5]|uniref:mannose-1-phosphate guanylyltransferase n=1 Tax=unclassified Parabacteroides TaxID=2649774 RepID=UPI00247542A1|nr:MULTISPECIES: mannose-1-phosphate guanylyltransferase [unclassified Parabacteroides]MDH6307033.1 mannose-1-phosphate guanylyltransferase [Parabacteroides sp. PH5-39]MDH6317948.1 mannose-1-phosphate guanylyltransferase [Parabacteroides sp. PF5-13]MDH6321648.1 mannose-1-phosphate guanylyltransferase [Parabacteroides sp. PH5-13]MDH6325399.1 mannose-1-phosphate guanylyltransferase [Parabacteroides sp. PH5-8]MDH6329136.1 mannose-1-phosphate guanylyltransferase [Parabacteroides sp. PH5-41]